MKIACHQPCYLPWVGYFHKMAYVDAFVILDQAQYTRGQHFNRTKIMIQGNARWLTVPVEFQKTAIANIRISDPSWAQKHITTLRQSYARAKHANDLCAILNTLEKDRTWLGLKSLVTVDMCLIDMLCSEMSILPEVYYESDLDYEPAMRTERLVNICKALGADTYVSGSGGSKQYLDVKMFEDEGISVEWQNVLLSHYEQSGNTGEFIPGLSVVDIIANKGWDFARKYIYKCSSFSVD